MNSDVDEDATWGTFTVQVTVALEGGVREHHELELELKDAQGQPAESLFPLPSDAGYDRCKEFYSWLNKKSAFGYALEVLAKAEALLTQRNGQEHIWLSQQKALCTYKNPAQQNYARLKDALAILKTDPCNLDDSTDPETLGLGGAIHKRMWQIDRSRQDLELALAFYLRGYDCMRNDGKNRRDYDAGAFTGVNAVYLHEAIALEVNPIAEPDARTQHLVNAAAIRKELLKTLLEPPFSLQNNWWIAASILEIYFGQASTEVNAAENALRQAETLPKQTTPWKRQSTAQQILAIARLHKKIWPKRKEEIDKLLKAVLELMLGSQINACAFDFDGKLGLALSGGGFRASLFHIGVLARLAELDLLRHVEVISCVSGGSIVGAHYYLLLRKLLQEKCDRDIERTDYIELVDELREQHVVGVQKNIRMRVGASWLSNLRMIFSPSTYSRTQRLGDLYEEILYRLVQDGEKKERWLNDAFIIPRLCDGNWDDKFSPKLDNWRRAAKVPILVLNATSLNTGRSWRFTASSMGEEESYGTDIDSTERLESIYYSAAPKAYRQYRLGQAVAASSCVPGLFTPIVITGLYQDRTVRLVDGGVHDNQGTRALLDQDCDSLIVSDASGQMNTEINPAHSELGVLLRMISVLQARIRVAQYQELDSCTRGAIVHKNLYLHLRKEIEAPAVSAQQATKTVVVGSVTSGGVATAAKNPLTSYRVRKDLQEALSGIRTDLDSFSDREALTLMYSGYAMATCYADRDFDAKAPPPPATNYQWAFLDVQDCAAGRAPGTAAPSLTYESLLVHMHAGSQLAFKIWRLDPVLKVLGLLIKCGAVLLALIGLWQLWRISQSNPPLMSAQGNLSNGATQALWFIVPAILIALVPKARALVRRTQQVLQFRSGATQVLYGVVMSTLGWLLCRIHLYTFDKLFLWRGKIK
jgi:predicted acylesterase/phospholipase RssA